jgi:hypothetical protein
MRQEEPDMTRTMARHITAVSAVIGAALTLAGCADRILSDDRIRDNTALALNVPVSALVISDRRYDGVTNTYYTAHTSRGTYACVINGGSVMAMGMTNPPQCARQ